MRLYRISKSKYAKDTSGEGSKLYGGRWNLKGIPAIYTADSAANAVLETIVHSPLKIVPKKKEVSQYLIFLMMLKPKPLKSQISPQTGVHSQRQLS